MLSANSTVSFGYPASLPIPSPPPQPHIYGHFVSSSSCLRIFSEAHLQSCTFELSSPRIVYLFCTISPIRLSRLLFRLLPLLCVISCTVCMFLSILSYVYVRRFVSRLIVRTCIHISFGCPILCFETWSWQIYCTSTTTSVSKTSGHCRTSHVATVCLDSVADEGTVGSVNKRLCQKLDFT